MTAGTIEQLNTDTILEFLGKFLDDLVEANSIKDITLTAAYYKSRLDFLRKELENGNS